MVNHLHESENVLDCLRKLFRYYHRTHRDPLETCMEMIEVWVSDAIGDALQQINGLPAGAGRSDQHREPRHQPHC